MRKDLRICIDRVVPDEAQPARALMTRVLRRRGHDGDGQQSDADDVFAPRMAMPVLKRWQTGSVLRCQFLDGSPRQRKRVEEKARQWEAYANINFQFVATGPAEIRISFTSDPGSWSALGTDALIERYFPRHQPTMNFGWLEDDTSDEEYERVVVHEFGHALGAIHEHQSPVASLEWNKKAVYETFSGSPNYWSPEEIEHNILRRYLKTHMNWTQFDEKSIMLYHFPADLFLNHRGTPNNTKMSDQDRQFIAKMYPGRR